MTTVTPEQYVPSSFHLAKATLALALLLRATSVCGAEKEEKQPEPPKVTLAVPFVVFAGSTNSIVIRGQNLTNASALHFEPALAGARWTIRAATKAEVPKDSDAKRAGDTQLTVEFTLPNDAPSGDSRIVVSSPAGESEAHPLAIVARGALDDEREPNGGFKQAQPLEPGRVLAGKIGESGDVDVFRFPGRRGQSVHIAVRAAAFGSLLDSAVTLHDAQGHTLATNDDRGSNDSQLEIRLTADGPYFVSVVDAHDRGGPLHGYLLSVTHSTPATR